MTSSPLGPRTTLRSLLLALALIWLAPGALAQFPSAVNNDTRTPVPGSGHDYINMLSETVDPSNGSLSVNVSTPVPPSRGITIPFSFDYSSGAVKQSQVCSTSGSSAYGCWAIPTVVGGVAPTSGGWSYRIPGLTASQEKVTCYFFGGTTGTTDVWFDYIFTDPSGMRHNLGMAHTPALIPDCTYPNQPYSVSTGGDDFYQATLNQTTGTVTVVSADGTVYNFPTGFAGGFGVNAFLPSTIEDRNGNIVTISEGSGGKITETDTAGRSAVSTSAAVGTNGTVSISGVPNVFTVTWETISGVYGSQYEQLGNGSNDGCNWTGNGGANITVIKSIELPNGTYYNFGYDSYGLLNQISYPTGAVVNYTRATTWANGQIEFFPPYPNNQFECLYGYYAPMVSQRTVKFDGVHTALVQNFSYTTAFGAGVEQATVQTTVYSSDGSTNRGTFKTVYNYFASSFGISDPDDWATTASTIPVEQTVQYYDYGQTNLLETVTKGWQDQFLLGCQLETHDGSGLSGTFYSYAAWPALSLMTDKKEYDYNQISGTSQCPQAPEGGPITPPSSPAPLRETAATYQSFADTPIYPTAPSILDRPATIKTYLNGTSGTLESETDYSYDQSTVGSVPSATQHDETNYSASSSAPRGNATTVVKKCLQSAPACSSGNPTTSYTYDETGQALSMKDPNLNTTQYSFADSYTSGTPPGSTNAYLTKVTYPPTGSVAHVESYSYSYADGQLTKSVDQNNEPTTYTYNTPQSGCSYGDGLDRLSKITYPDTGTTTYCYNDASYNSSTPSPSITTTRAINGTTNLTTLTAFDGLGHTVRSVLTSDPDCSTGDRTDTTYDGLARTYTVSNPYCTTSDPTYGLTAYTYDALGRTCLVEPPGGTAGSGTCPTAPVTGDTTTIYGGRATEVADASGKQRITQVNVLGQLTSVCEVTSTTLTVGIAGSTAPATCNLDISATGFATTYLYDALDDLTNVTQGPLNGRSFTYNSLGQLTIASNPESGTICYGTLSGGTCQQNGYDANGNLVYKTDARGTKITYAYDADNNLTGKTYSDTTPAVTYNYNETSSQGVTLTNTNGRKSSESTAGTYTTSTIFSYDSMGASSTIRSTGSIRGCGPAAPLFPIHTTSPETS